MLAGGRVVFIGVFGLFCSKSRWPWFTWWFFLIYQGNPSISPKRTPMVAFFGAEATHSTSAPRAASPPRCSPKRRGTPPFSWGSAGAPRRAWAWPRRPGARPSGARSRSRGMEGAGDGAQLPGVGLRRFFWPSWLAWKRSWSGPALSVQTITWIAVGLVL